MSQVQQPALSFETVWQMFQETDRRSKETDLQMKETNIQMKETNQMLKELAIQSKETERFIQASLADTHQVIKNLSKQLGDLGNRLGEFVEHAVAPAVVQLFQAQGIEVHEVHPEVSSHRNGEGIEIDLLVVNDGALVAVECKSKLTQTHVDEHLARMEKLKRLLPLYKNHRALGAVAAMVMSDSVKTYAQNQGFYVLCQNGENVLVSNSAGFTPKAW